MGGLFAVGSLGFVVGPASVWVTLVGTSGDALTFFGASILFTLGGLAQCLLAAPERSRGATGLASWRTAWIQSLGTLLFNAMTLAAIFIVAGEHRYDLVVWGPNAAGSLCFLISGTIFYASSPRRGLLPARRHRDWWEPSVNLLGCVLFAVSALTGFATSARGALISAPVSNWTTTLGAACFLACGLSACGLGQTLKAPRLRRLRGLGAELVRELDRVEEELPRRQG